MLATKLPCIVENQIICSIEKEIKKKISDEDFRKMVDEAEIDQDRLIKLLQSNKFSFAIVDSNLGAYKEDIQI